MAGKGVKANRNHLSIGLLGGSFNPAHEGHRYISIAALKSLQLDSVWWLVSPQNPLKSPLETRNFEERLCYARKIARHPRIQVMDIERMLPSNYTIYTLRYLKKRFPNTHFTWIMGADNLVQFPAWHKWQEIVPLLPIIVYDRDKHIYTALAGKMAVKYRKYRIKERGLHKLSHCPPPAWGVMRIRRHPLSATAIRKREYNKNIE